MFYRCFKGLWALGREGEKEGEREMSDAVVAGFTFSHPLHTHKRAHTRTPTASVCICGLLLKCHWVPGWNGVVAGRVQQGVSGGQTEINRWSGVQRWNKSCDISERGPSKFTMLPRAFLHLHVSIKVRIKVQGFGYIWYRLLWTHIPIQEGLLRLLWSMYDQENLTEKKSDSSKLRHENKEVFSPKRSKARRSEMGATVRFRVITVALVQTGQFYPAHGQTHLDSLKGAGLKAHRSFLSTEEGAEDIRCFAPMDNSTLLLQILWWVMSCCSWAKSSSVWIALMGMNNHFSEFGECFPTGIQIYARGYI